MEYEFIVVDDNGVYFRDEEGAWVDRPHDPVERETIFRENGTYYQLGATWIRKVEVKNEFIVVSDDGVTFRDRAGVWDMRDHDPVERETIFAQNGIYFKFRDMWILKVNHRYADNRGG